MTVRWFTYTSILMIVAVVFTLVQFEETKDPPGTTSRWWDGTTVQVETYYSDGKVQTRTKYGEDGKTVLKFEQFNNDGELMRESIRLANGNIENKRFSDGNLAHHEILLPDKSGKLMSRTYHENGKLQSEATFTDDGKTPQLRRQYYFDGTLMMEYKILPNADQQSTQWDSDGTMKSTNIFHANSTTTQIEYYKNGKPFTVLKKGQIVAGLPGLENRQFYSPEGDLIQENLQPDEKTQVINVYKEGSLVVRQHFELVDRDFGDGHVFKTSRLISVDEFKEDSSHPYRSVKVNDPTGTRVISLFREDGSLKTVKHQLKDQVTKQIDYDESGKEAISETTEGEAETLDDSVLQSMEHRPFLDKFEKEEQ